MFSLEANHWYFMCQHPVNMRKGIDSLFNLIEAESPLSPMSGDVFVFFSKNRQSVKLLRWDTDGFLLYQKRLERGTFEMPRINPVTGASHSPGRTHCSSTAMPEQSEVLSSIPWPTPAACITSTSSSTSPTCSTESQESQIAPRWMPSGFSSQTAGQRKSRANAPAFF